MSSIASDDSASAWVSDFGAAPTQSLFDGTVLETAQEAVEYDQKKGYDLPKEGSRLHLDLYGRMRLVNLIRRDRLDVQEALALQPGPWTSDDSLLKPIIEDDPLLQLDFDWEGEEDDVDAAHSTAQAKAKAQAGPSTSASGSELEQQLARMKLELQAAQKVVEGVLGDDEPEERHVKRDDDTHYFDSYEENDIHEIMLRDTTRTVSYARYILSSPKVKGGVVMDVGCGTGILSMLAARAGAKKVYAIEASGLAAKARENIRNNGLEGVIEVIQGKVEDINLDVKVDVIISEWMGYMLLYESMLDSVLHARDRFLAHSGEMMPGRTRLVMSAITGDKLWSERMTFWESVYGFNMTAMRGVYLTEGIVDHIPASEIVSSDSELYTIDSHTATVKSLDFKTPFSMTITQDAQVKAFLTHFDTFFGPGEVVDTSLIGDETKDQVETKEGDERAVSFTTGPRGKETHWKQVSFLLDPPIQVKQAQEVKGTFFCKKSDTNSRELDVELHIDGYGVRTYRVR